MSGKVVHFEIPFDDGDRAGAFYEAAFGWTIMPMPDMGYTIVTHRSQRPGDRPDRAGVHQRRHVPAR